MAQMNESLLPSLNDNKMIYHRETYSLPTGLDPVESEINDVDNANNELKEQKLQQRPTRNKFQHNVINNLNTTKPSNRHSVILNFLVILYTACLVQAGFWTFYFPNLFKPKGYDELNDMISLVNAHINATKDAYADTKYFWGKLQELDEIPVDQLYPEESVCADVFPMFRELAIDYARVDYEYYIKPSEEYRNYLVEFRNKWYPGGIESKAALPREWEQNLLDKELEIKIDWFERLTNEETFKAQRDKLLEIWKNVRRSLDTSLPCIYLRYAYRQVAEDINQVALEANLVGMKEAKKAVEASYKRVEKFKNSDKKIIEEIQEDLKKEDRFTIKS